MNVGSTKSEEETVASLSDIIRDRFRFRYLHAHVFQLAAQSLGKLPEGFESQTSRISPAICRSTSSPAVRYLSCSRLCNGSRQAAGKRWKRTGLNDFPMSSLNMEAEPGIETGLAALVGNCTILFSTGYGSAT